MQKQEIQELSNDIKLVSRKMVEVERTVREAELEYQSSAKNANLKAQELILIRSKIGEEENESEFEFIYHDE